MQAERFVNPFGEHTDAKKKAKDFESRFSAYTDAIIADTVSDRETARLIRDLGDMPQSDVEAVFDHARKNTTVVQQLVIISAILDIAEEAYIALEDVTDDVDVHSMDESAIMALLENRRRFNAAYTRARDFLMRMKEEEGGSPLIAMKARAGLAGLYMTTLYSDPSLATMEESFALEEIVKKARRESASLMKTYFPKPDAHAPVGMARVARGLLATTDDHWMIRDVLPPTSDNPETAARPLAEFIQTSFGKSERDAQEAALLLGLLHTPIQRDFFKKGMGFGLEKLSVREQLQLLDFLIRTNAEEMEEAFHAIREFGVNCARAFLSCEYGREYGNEILRIAKHADRKTAAAIFKKYSEIADLAERASEDLIAEIFVDKGKDVDYGRVNEELLSRAKEMLAKPHGAQTVRDLERYKSDMLLLASVFKAAYKGKEKQADFNAFKGLSVDAFDPQELAPAERERLLAKMKGVLFANWKGKGADETQLVLHGLEEGFTGTKGRTRFYRLKKDDETIAFLRFDARPDLGDDAVYAGSFNVQPGLRGAALGSALFHHVLDREARTHRVFAHVLATDRVVSNYVEDFGFMITGVERELHERGKESVWFTIERDDALRAELGGEREQKSFTLPDEQDRLVEWIGEETAGGEKVVANYVLSRDSSGARATVSIAEVPASVTLAA